MGLLPWVSSLKGWEVVCLKWSISRAFSLLARFLRLAPIKTSFTLLRISFSSSSLSIRASLSSGLMSG